jgi:AcrR family transcriptional regulator
VPNMNRVWQAAVRLFADQGFAATGIRDIGREAGLNSATLYHYAGSKEELLAGIMRTALEALLGVGREAAGHSADPAVALARLVRAHVSMEAVNPLTSRVSDQEIRALGPANQKLVIGLRDDYESLFARVLERGARTGQFQVADLKVTRFALLEMCNGVSNWYRPGGRLSVPDLQDRFVELACRLAGVPAVARADSGPDVTVPRLDSEPRRSGRTTGASA